MKKLRKITAIAVLCPALLCGCGNNIAEVTPAPTAETEATPISTATENMQKPWIVYEDYKSVLTYKFKSSPLFDGNKVEFNGSKTKEEQVFDACVKTLGEIKEKLDGIDRLFIHFENLEGDEQFGDVLTLIDIDAVLDDKETVEQWKSLVKDAELELYSNYIYGDKNKYSGIGANIIFCAEISGEVKELFSNFGAYYCNSPLPVTRFKFSSKEKEKEYLDLCNKLNELAEQKYEQALSEPGNNPFLTD